MARGGESRLVAKRPSPDGACCRGAPPKTECDTGFSGGRESGVKTQDHASFFPPARTGGAGRKP